MALLCLFLHVAIITHVSILVYPCLLLLLLDQGVSHGGHVGHQEGAGEPRRCAHQGRNLIQFRISEFDFESNSEFKTTLPSIWHTILIRPLWHLWCHCTSYSVAKVHTQTSVQISNSNLLDLTKPFQIPLVKKLEILICMWCHINLNSWWSGQEKSLGNLWDFFPKGLNPF
jgi:hypothetical protein